MIILFSLSYNIFLKKILTRSDDPIPRGSQGQKTFLAHFVDKKTPGTMAQSTQFTIPHNRHKTLGLSCNKIKW